MFGKVYFVTFNLAELKSRVHNRIENLLYKSVVQICASDAISSSMKCLHNHFFVRKWSTFKYSSVKLGILLNSKKPRRFIFNIVLNSRVCMP